MYKYIYTLILSFLLFNCTEVIDIDLEDGETRLVIDAYFEVSSEEENSISSDENGVQLSLSAPYFDEEISTVSNAQVFITNLNDNSVLIFEESDVSGFFVPENDETFIPEFETSYELSVIYNNETYTSTTEVIPTVEIDTLTQGGTALERLELIITYTDEITRNDFYLFDVDYNLFGISQDQFYQGQTFDYSYFYDVEELERENDLTIKIMGIDENYFNYFNLILNQSSGSGNPFQSVPVLVKGNIVNTTNEDNYAFGYFRMSEAYTKTITVTKKED